jgi:hypothetical protein
VAIYRPGCPIMVLTAADKLTGDDVIPGFEYPLAGLFAGMD